MAIEVAHLKCEASSDSQAIYSPFASEERDCGQNQKYISETKRREERTLKEVHWKSASRNNWRVKRFWTLPKLSAHCQVKVDNDERGRSWWHGKGLNWSQWTFLKMMLSFCIFCHWYRQSRWPESGDDNDSSSSDEKAAITKPVAMRTCPGLNRRIKTKRKRF